MTEKLPEEKTLHSHEREYLIKQKEQLEIILLDLNKIKPNPFNVFGLIKKIKRLILIIGSYAITSLLSMNDLSQNHNDICSMIASLQRQIVSLNERIKKLEK